MDLLSREREKYSAVWGDPQYRVVSPGERHVLSAIDWMSPTPGSSFTDWGCGTGRAAETLHAHGFGVHLVDIAENAYRGSLPFTQACLWDMPEYLRVSDYGFCTDVMEHIPTEHVDDVLAGIATRTIFKCYFQIALFHDNHFTQNGPLHLSVFPPDWWREKLLAHFRNAEFRMIRHKHLLAVAET
ncbi:hypothetical protein [Caudoviricetes sp.]|nr:hypothetical protein [Caudoviricetes sp.]